MREPGARRVSGYCQCLLKDGEHFSRENSRASDAEGSYIGPINGRSVQSKYHHDIKINQKMVHVHHTYIFTVAGHTAYLLTHIPQDSDKGSQTTFVDVNLDFFLITKKLLP